MVSGADFSLYGQKHVFPPGRQPLPISLFLDITLALYIHNRPWKHPGNTDTLGLSIMRTHGSPGLKSLFSPPHARTFHLTAMLQCCTSLQSLSSLPEDKIFLVPIQVMQYCHLKKREKQCKCYLKDLSGTEQLIGCSLLSLLIDMILLQ